MTLGKVAVLSIIAIFAAFLLAFAWPVRAADCTSYDAELATIRADGIAPYIIPDDKLQKTVRDVENATGDDYGAVTRGFMFETPTQLVIGFEADGCLLPPVEIARPQGKNV